MNVTASAAADGRALEPAFSGGWMYRQQKPSGAAVTNLRFIEQIGS